MKIKTSSSHVVDGLSIFQFATDVQDTLPYQTSARALAEHLIEVREVSEQGSVNHLLVENPSDAFVFFMDGDILAGAKQNRVLNISVLLAPRSKTVVPVSCVERRRWHSVSAKFSSTNHSAPSSLRAFKSSSLLARKQRNPQFMADQGGVWEHIAMLKASAGANAPTDNLSDVFTHKQSLFDHVLKGVQHVAGANGLAVFHGDRLISLDVFNRVDALVDYLPRLLRGVLLDAVSLRHPASIPPVECLSVRLDNLMAAATLNKAEPQPTIGAGHEQRFEWTDAVGFHLKFDRHPIHLSVLGKPSRTE